MKEVVFCQACGENLLGDPDYFTVKARGDQPYHSYYFCNIQCLTRYYCGTTFSWRKTRDVG